MASKTLQFVLLLAFAFVFFAHSFNFVNADVSSQCKDDMKRLFNRTYGDSTKMLLATGKGPGEWGDYDSCTQVSHARYCLLTSSEKFTIKTGDKTATFQCDELEAQCSVGVCIPGSCSDQDVREIVALQNKLTDIEVTCSVPNTLDAKNIVGIVIVSLLVFLSLIGTIWDLHDTGRLQPAMLWYRRGEEPDPAYLPAVNHQTGDILVQGEDSVSESLLANPNADKAELQTERLNKHKREEHHTGGKFGQFFKSFSFVTNFMRLLTPIPGDFGALNGIRVLSMFWVILGHTFDFLSEIGVHNLSYAFEALKTRSVQLIVNTPFAVDTFFFLGGFLLGYFMLKELITKGRVSLWKFYFHRLWRLIPLYGFLIMIYVCITPILSNGPLWPHYRDNLDNANSYCWTNLLFINNFFPSYNNMCMRWSWFLADDMQFYVISPIFLFSFYYNKIVGWAILSMFFTASLVTNAVLFWQCEDCSVGIAGESKTDYFNDIYVKPYTRIMPYLIGLACAFILNGIKKEPTEVSTKNKFPRINPIAVVVAFLFALGVILSIIYGTYESGQWDPKGARSMMWLVLSRPAFAVSIGIFVMIFSMGYGGVANTFLASSWWDPLAKLTYAAYLTHPMVIRILYYSQVVQPAFSYLNLSYWYVGTLVFSYAFAAIWYCIIEKAFMNLEPLILPGGRDKH